jgi:hypothetical protein
LHHTQVDALLGYSSEKSRFIEAVLAASRATRTRSNAQSTAPAQEAYLNAAKTSDLEADVTDVSAHLVSSSEAAIPGTHHGVRVTVHCMCGSMDDAKEVNRRLKDGRVRIQAAMREALIGMHAQIPQQSAFKVVVTKQDASKKSELHELQMQWLVNKLGVAESPRLFTERIGQDDDVHVDVSVCIRSGDLSGGEAWQNACAAFLLLEPLVNHKQERWWQDASRAVSKAAAALSQASMRQSGALAVLVAVSSEALQALKSTGSATDTIAWRLGLNEGALAEAKVFILELQEVLEASALGSYAGMQEIATDFCKLHPQAYSTVAKGRKETNAVWLAVRFAAQHSKRMPSVSQLRVADVVRSRTATLLASVNPDAVLSADYIRFGLDLFNKKCLAEVRAVARASHSDILALPWPVPELAQTDMAWPSASDVQQVDQALCAAFVPVPARTSVDEDNETISGILTYAYKACIDIVRANAYASSTEGEQARTLAQANLAALRKEAEIGDVLVAKRCAARMLSHTLFFR